MVRGFNLWATAFVCLFLIALNGYSQLTPKPGVANNNPVNINGPAYDIHVVGNYLYAASFSSKIYVVDITSPTGAFRATETGDGIDGAYLNTPTGIFAQGNYVFVAAKGSDALEILEITNPGPGPIISHKSALLDDGTGTNQELTKPVDVVVAGNYAYLVTQDGSEGWLEIVDITNKSAPAHAGKVNLSTGTLPNCIAVSGDYAYVGGSSTFKVVDINPPGSAAVVATLTDGAAGTDPELSLVEEIKIEGNYAYMIARTGNYLEIIDISTPTTPTHAKKVAMPGGTSQPTSVSLTNGFAYVTSQSASAVYFDVDPVADASAVWQTPPIATFIESGSAVGNYGYLPTQNGLYIYHIFYPSPPALLQQSQTTSTGFQLNWEGVQSVSGYEVDVSTDNFANLLPNYNPKTVPGNENFATVTGLSPATQYQYRIRGVNTNGTGDNSTTGIAYTTAGELTPNVSNITHDGYTVSWTAVPDVQYYEYAHSQATDMLQNPPLPLLFTTQTSINITQQLPGTQFYFILRAKNGGGEGPLSEAAVLTKPLAPNFDPAGKFTLVGQTSFKVNWILYPLIQSSLRIDVATDAAFANMVTGYSDLSLPISNSLVVNTNIQPNTTYYVRLRSVNASGASANSATETVITMPAAMTATAATLPTTSSFRANWTEVPGVTKYWIDVATTNTFDAKLASYNNREVSAPSNGLVVDVGLSAGTYYYYRVRCTNAAGDSPNSNAITVLTLSPAPVLGNANGVTQTSFIPTWSQYIETTGYFLDVATDAGFTNFVGAYQNQSVGNVSSATVSGLTANTTYYVRVRGINPSGTSPNSVTKTYTTLPDALTANAATLNTSSSFRANWTEMPGAVKYWLDVATDISFASKLTNYNNREITVPANGLVVDGLQPGNLYHYRVRVSNSAGDSPNSNVISTAAVPDVPTLNNPSAVTLTTFDASWNPGVNGATGYFLDVATDASFADFITGFQNKSVGNVTSTTVTGLTASTTYYYRLRAANTGGTTGSSASKTVTTAPPAPVATSATSIGQTGFTANWNSVPNVTDYRLDVSSDNTFVSNVVVNNVLVASATTLAVTGLTGGTTYHYRVRATNATAASANSNVISQVTIPATPTTVAAESTGQNSFTAKWAAATGASEYFVDVKDEAGSILSGYNNVSVTSGTSLVVDAGILAGTNYSYVVRAKNTAGTSPSSSAQTVLTVPPTPVAIEATVSGTVSFVAKWQSSKSATKYFINVATSPTFVGSLLPGYSNFDVGNAQQTTVTVNAPATGATYYYQVSAQNGSGTSPFSAAITVNTPVVSFPAINLPTGGTVEDYVIISIPDGTTPTTTLSAASFKNTWRIMHYDNATKEVIDVPDMSSLKVGRGYWVNSNLDEAPTITMTGQTTAGAKTITLGPGWNQVGNPFNFGISWSDVKAKNSSNSSIANLGDLWIYDRIFKKSDDLKGYGGGFVNNKNTTSVDVTIPANVVRTGRTASTRHEIEGRDIADDEWFLPLTLEAGGKANDVGGLGMHPDANNSIDPFDEIALPRFFNLSQISTHHPEFFQPRFMTDVVQSTDSFTWTFNITSEERDVSLSWDNSAWSDATLYLIDDAAGVLLDMGSTSSYGFDAQRTRSIRFAFGRNGQFPTDITSLGQPFPNPSSERVTFPFISRPGETVGITVLDLTGRTVGTISSANGNGGYEEVVWDAVENRLTPGVYLYQFTTSSGVRKTGRIVLK